MLLRPNAVCKFLLVIFAVALMITLLPVSSVAQDEHPKFELFGGYSWYNPGGKIEGTKVPSFNKGLGIAGTYYFNKWLGLTADYGYHTKDSSSVHSGLFGPQFKIRSEHFQPFAEVLFGFTHAKPLNLDTKNSPAIAAGGGFDIPIAHWFSWRLIQADYLYTTYKDKTHLQMINSERFDGARIQSGALFTFGGAGKPLPVSASCSAAEPAEVMAGEPVKVTITPTNFNPKRTLSYTWESTGGKASTGNASTTIDTTGMNPGSYTVTGKVNDDRKGNKMSVASCNTNFTVKEPPKHPPVMNCSANPGTVKSGDPSTITATASSPDERPLTYSWNASAGRVTGTGTTVQLDTAGAPAGPITVTGTTTDDRGLTANCTATVNVEVPPPPPTASKLNEIGFPDKRKPARVDNAAKAILDDVALKLQRDADAKAVVIGMADAAEAKRTKNLAAMRAYNTKEYLVNEKGIDPSRIELRTDGEGQKAEIWIVPAGASFAGENTSVVDESMFAKKPAKKR